MVHPTGHDQEPPVQFGEGDGEDLPRPLRVEFGSVRYSDLVDESVNGVEMVAYWRPDPLSVPSVPEVDGVVRPGGGDDDDPAVLGCRDGRNGCGVVVRVASE
jgi:hypothetical protein